jgi:hypothetical protein
MAVSSNPIEMTRLEVNESKTAGGVAGMGSNAAVASFPAGLVVSGVVAATVVSGGCVVVGAEVVVAGDSVVVGAASSSDPAHPVRTMARARNGMRRRIEISPSLLCCGIGSSSGSPEGNTKNRSAVWRVRPGRL